MDKTATRTGSRTKKKYEKSVCKCCSRTVGAKKCQQSPKISNHTIRQPAFILTDQLPLLLTHCSDEQTFSALALRSLTFFRPHPHHPCYQHHCDSEVLIFSQGRPLGACSRSSVGCRLKITRPFRRGAMASPGKRRESDLIKLYVLSYSIFPHCVLGRCDGGKG